jgi:methyl-accepting chemotaxis protein
MNNIAIKKLMLVSSVLTLVLMMGFAGYLYRAIIQIDEHNEHKERLSQTMLAIKDARFNVVQIQQFLTDVGATHDEGGFEEAAGNLKGAEEALDLVLGGQPSLRRDIDQLKQKIARVHDVGVEMAWAYIREGRDAGNRIMKAPGSGLDDASAALSEQLEELVGGLQSDLDAASVQLEETIHSALFMTIVLAVLVFLFQALVMALLYYKIVPPLERLNRSLKDIADGEGDLSVQLEVRGSDELGQVSGSFNRFTDKLHGMVKQVAEASVRLSTEAESLSVVVDETSRDMRVLRGDTEVAATAITEMGATVQEVAGNSNSAAEATRQADIEASNGQQVVENTISNIGALASEVERGATVIHQLEIDVESIGTILDVIRTIADQTNLLALNAAIEAARAGEQGRGFAVVADEVRSLAQKTQQSTQEIQEKIETLQQGAKHAVKVMDQSRERAETSVEQAAKAGEALTAITSAVGVMRDMTMQIASATEEQTAVANELSSNVEHINAVAVETDEKAKNAAQTSGQLGVVLAELTKQVNTFKFAKDVKMDLANAKTAHLAWKSRLRSFLDGNTSLSEQQAVSHHHCDFGRWYYSDGLQKFGHISMMRSIERPHESLHRLIKDIVQAKNGGNMAEAERLFAQIEPLSREIVGMINQLEQQI